MAAIKSRSLVNHVLRLSTLEDEEDEAAARVRATARASRQAAAAAAAAHHISSFLATAPRLPRTQVKVMKDERRNI